MNDYAIRKAEIHKRLQQGQSGANFIASNLMQPLQEYQDYLSVGRKALMVETLAQGQDPLIDYDVDGNLAYVVADLSGDVLKITNPQTIRLNTFDIVANPSVSYEALQARKYDLEARINQKSRAEVFRVEDRMVFNALIATATHKVNANVYAEPKYDLAGNKQSEAIVVGKKQSTIAGNPVNSPIVSTYAKFSLNDISAAQSQIERHGGLRPTSIFMNPFNLQAIRAMNVNSTQGYFVDFETSREIMQTGRVGIVYGMELYVSPEIPKNIVLVCAEPQYTGRIVERIPLTLTPYDEPAQRRLSFAVFENVGILAHNPKAVCAITLS